MKELTGGAQILISERDAPIVADGGRSDPRNRDGRQRFQPVKVDRVFQDGEKVTLGGTTLTAVVTPGHTKGCTTWTMVAEENCRNYNVVFSCGVGGIRGPLVNNAKYPTVAEDFAMSFESSLALPCDIHLGPHARTFGLLEKR